MRNHLTNFPSIFLILSIDPLFLRQPCIFVVSVTPQTTKLIRSASPSTLSNDFAEAFVNITGNKVSALIRHPANTPQPV